MKYFPTHPEQERAVLVGLTLKPNNPAETESHLEELASLAETAGAVPIKKFIQRLPQPNPGTFIGIGMLENIKDYVKENQIDTAIFDDELSPSQLKNIEKQLGCKILDRTHLILDIFASRAKTAHARIQVELAQYQYLLPRLAGMWPHLERQRGGVGLRGPGEREIETDRRVIRDKIAQLKKQLIRIDRQKSTQRKSRGKLVRAALVGYTNAGKSTILNLLSKSRVTVENKLFATLDTTVRKVVIKNLPLLLADTVGFIHKLPHCLVESFKATLDEVREADLLLHVIDISHPNFAAQMHVVHDTLREIGADNKPLVAVFNKIDVSTKATENNELPLAPMNPVAPWLNEETSVYISATKKTNIDILRQKLYTRAREIHITRYPYNDFLYEL
ncbi:MAG: GTPase HflX [Candidatus Aminicenantes bacterium]|nr:MAG: GTPase HflX [Candidatus Aminicenantes bacterium]